MRLESLEELRVLQAVLGAGSIVGAGARLGQPPRTVGRRLAALEARLGVSLVVRTTRSLTPSAAAVRFVQRCGPALEELARAEALLLEERGELTGTVRLAIPSLMSTEVTEAAQALGRRHPGLELDVLVTDAPLPALADAGLALAVTVYRPEGGQERLRRLVENTAGLGASPAYLAERRPPRTPSDLAEHACLRFSGQDTWSLVRHGQQVEVSVSGPLISSDSRMLRQAMLAGMGIGPAHAGTPQPGIVSVLPGWTWPRFELWLRVDEASQDLARVRVVKDALADATRRAFSPP